MLIPWFRGRLGEEDGTGQSGDLYYRSLGQLSNMAVKSLFDSHNSAADGGRCWSIDSMHCINTDIASGWMGQKSPKLY